MTQMRSRVEGIDALRGLVIVFMVMDHAREYSAGTGRVSDPMQLDAVTPLLFWMRWLAHFCAPVFTLLAGVSAGLEGMRLSAPELSRYLVTRGLVLIVLEFTVVHPSWTFSFVWPMLYAQVIWGIGLSMVVAGLLQHAPVAARAAIGVLCVVGHNALDSWHPTSPAPLHWAWAILHDRQVMPLWEGLSVRTSYPVLPMIGVLLLGEVVGRWYVRTPDAVQRARLLRLAGATMLVAFVVLRSTNWYGDPHDAVYDGPSAASFMSMLNVTKYPMSLAFLLMTVGPALLLLASWERAMPAWSAPITSRLIVMGQVPMFLYIAHLYLLHALAMLWALVDGYPWSTFDFHTQIGGMPKGFGFPLWVTIPFSLCTIVLLWPAAQWYARLRASKRYAITRFV